MHIVKFLTKFIYIHYKAKKHKVQGVSQDSCLISLKFHIGKGRLVSFDVPIHLSFCREEYKIKLIYKKMLKQLDFARKICYNKKRI